MSDFGTSTETANQLKTRLASGDLQWVRERFASGELNFLRDRIPADDRTHFARRLAENDLPWIREVLGKVDVPGVGPLVSNDWSSSGAHVPPLVTPITPPAPSTNGGYNYTISEPVVPTIPTYSAQSTSTEFSEVTQTVVETTKKRPTWLWIVGAVVVAFLIGILLKSCGSDDPKATTTTVAGGTATTKAGAATTVAGGTATTVAGGTPTTVAGGTATTKAATASTVAPVTTTVKPATTVAPTTTVKPATTVAPTVAPTAAPTTAKPPVAGTDYTVYFATGGEAPSADGKAKLAEAAAKIKALGTTAKVKITGYTDYRGTVASNTALSKARAETVRKELEALGAKAEYTTIGGGELLAETNLDLARRVEIDLP